MSCAGRPEAATSWRASVWVLGGLVGACQTRPHADGSDATQLTYLDAASFAPFFHPSSKRVLFATNYGDPKGREFDIWAIDVQGTRLERITTAPGFDGFPLFSPDGKRLAFSSNRATPPGAHDTNVFVADWRDVLPPLGPFEFVFFDVDYSVFDFDHLFRFVMLVNIFVEGSESTERRNVILFGAERGCFTLRLGNVLGKSGGFFFRELMM